MINRIFHWRNTMGHGPSAVEYVSIKFSVVVRHEYSLCTSHHIHAYNHVSFNIHSSNILSSPTLEESEPFTLGNILELAVKLRFKWNLSKNE